MVFGAPALAVAGAAAVSIPVAIHLLSRVRRTRVDWGAMRFVRLAYQRQRRRLRFERWLLLAVRCLLVALAGLALAGPVLTGALARWGADAAGAADDGPLHLVVDHGLSAGATINAAVGGPGESGAATTRFDPTRDMAAALVAAAADTGRDVRVWSAVPGPAGQPRAATDGAGLTDLAPTHRLADVSGTLARVAQARAADAAAGRGAGVVAVVSDWSRGVVTAMGSGGASDTASATEADASEATPEANPSPYAAADALGGRLWISPPDPGAANVQVAALRPRRPLVLRAEGAGAPPAVVSARVTLRRFGAVLDADRSRVSVTLTPVATTAATARPMGPPVPMGPGGQDRTPSASSRRWTGRRARPRPP